MSDRSPVSILTDTMTLEEKVGQRFGVGFHGLEAPTYLLDWLRAGRVGTVILFARNVESPAQVARLTASLHAAAKFPLLIGVDQEGGTVARLRQGFSESPGAMALSAAGADGPALAEQVSRVLALEMAAVGINWDFAPSLDILYNVANPALGTRSFGASADRVAEMGRAAVQGFQSGGVAACAKHFPGLGSTAIDTHLALPRLDTSVDQLVMQDMPPFRAAIDAGVATIMTTHTIFTALDDRLPATLSAVIIQQLLRQRLGFERVVISDCMEMKAIADHFSPAETAILGAQAGLDIILFSHTRAVQEAAYDGLLDAARQGQITDLDAANARIAALKAAYPVTINADLGTLRQPDHLAMMITAARAAVTLIDARDAGQVLPMVSDALLVEFASLLESGILESGGSTGLLAALKIFNPALHSVVFSPMPYAADQITAAETLLPTVATLIIACRNAWLNDEQRTIIMHLIARAKQVIIVCLRDPRDAQVIRSDAVFAQFGGAYAIMATCGDSAPSLQAAAEAISGQLVTHGVLPIPL